MARRTVGEPHDRLTRLCEAMTDALDAHPDAEGTKAIVFLQDGERGGIVLHGYDDDADAMGDLFVHMAAVFEANGHTLMVLPIGEG